jgi:hypothetical protein
MEGSQMTQDDIIRMAKESGAYFQIFYPAEAFPDIKKENQEHFSGYVMSYDQIIEFALGIIVVNNIDLFKKK